MRRSIHIALALATMTASSCLVISDPEYIPPAKTAPFFLPDTASPNADRVVQVCEGEPGKKFSALMQSEDAGVELDARLYLDYGSTTASGKVYELLIDASQPLPGAWSDGPREVSATYFGEFKSMSVGCHRFTLMVIHGNFDDDGCAEEDGDYATQTWLVQNCGANCDCADPFNAADCPPVADDRSTRCPLSTDLPGNAGGSP